MLLFALTDVSVISESFVTIPESVSEVCVIFSSISFCCSAPRRFESIEAILEQSDVKIAATAITQSARGITPKMMSLLNVSKLSSSKLT